VLAKIREIIDLALAPKEEIEDDETEETDEN
jgi:hypothetical protein